MSFLRAAVLDLMLLAYRILISITIDRSMINTGVIDNVLTKHFHNLLGKKNSPNICQSYVMFLSDPHKYLIYIMKLFKGYVK